MMPMPRISMKWRTISGRFAHQPVVGHPADVHHVVRRQLMAPLDQLQRGLALAHAAFAGQENAYAVNVHQHAVTGHVREPAPG